MPVFTWYLILQIIPQLLSLICLYVIDVLPGVGCATNLILATLSGELKTSVGTENYISPTGNAATKRYEFGLQY